METSRFMNLVRKMNNVLLKIGVVVTGSLLLLAEALAHHPVMDMAPRWEDGYGLQLRHEWYGSDELLDGDSTVSNPLNRGRYVHRTWLEGVYTFDRSKRLTFKLPQIHQRRRVIQDGVAVTQSPRMLSPFHSMSPSWGL